MPDPRKIYPIPPFPKQSQPFPGLDAKVKPKPDFGRNSYQGANKLLGKVAVITGGDSGIGKAVAYAFACEGADVAISYLDAEEADAQEVKKAVESVGKKALLLPGDIRTETRCQKIINKTLKMFGKIDILVNNAAYQKSIPSFSEITQELLDQTFQTNVYAPFFLIKAAWKNLQPGSSIINTTSVQAYRPSAHISVYASTKGALTNMTKSLAPVCMERGIRINAVAPGPIWTPLNTIDPPKGHVENFGSSTWTKRPGQPVEVAKVFVFLASDDASYVTGHTYGVTGGTEMGL